MAVAPVSRAKRLAFSIRNAVLSIVGAVQKTNRKILAYDSPEIFFHRSGNSERLICCVFFCVLTWRCTQGVLERMHASVYVNINNEQKDRAAKI
jgi:hypothetical protein